MSTYTTSPLPLYNTCQVLMMVGRHSPIVLTYWSVTTSFASDDHKDSLRKSIVRRVNEASDDYSSPRVIVTCHRHVSSSAGRPVHVTSQQTSVTDPQQASIADTQLTSKTGVRHWSIANVNHWTKVDWRALSYSRRQWPTIEHYYRREN